MRRRPSITGSMVHAVLELVSAGFSKSECLVGGKGEQRTRAVKKPTKAIK